MPDFQSNARATDHASERRCGHDRRRHTLRTIAYGALSGRRGRRRTARREGHNYYLDWYQPTLVITGLTVLLLSSLDAFFTLMLLERGAYEANVFMAELMHIGIREFVYAKVAITGIGVTFLLMHAHFHLFGFTSGKRLLQIIMAAYACLIAYELVLLAVLP